jgi:TatD DNase family protein
MLETWDRATSGFDSRGVIHCFSGSWKQARRYFNLDFMISVTGIMTHGGYQGEILKKAPLSRLLAESDCPYTTSVKWGIRRSEPAYIKHVAANIAGIRKIAIAEVERQLEKNAHQVFKKIRC